MTAARQSPTPPLEPLRARSLHWQQPQALPLKLAAARAAEARLQSPLLLLAGSAALPMPSLPARCPHAERALVHAG